MFQEAATAYNNDPRSTGAGSGGVCLWVSPRIKHLISSRGHSRSGRYQWVRFSGVPGRDVGILNLYAANQTAERCELWYEMLLDLPKDCRWIFMGDWNFVERPEDRSRSRNPLMTKNERQLFQQLKSTFEVEDPFPPNSAVRFSWDNHRSGTQRMLARLNRVYSFKSPGEVVTNADYKIRGDNSFSNHLAVFRQVWLTRETKWQSPYVMNARHLKDPVVIDKIKHIWVAHSRLPFFSKVRRVVRFYRQF
jgi:exonuclease III